MSYETVEIEADLSNGLGGDGITRSLTYAQQTDGQVDDETTLVRNQYIVFLKKSWHNKALHVLLICTV